jgi:ribosome-associated protein
MKSKKTTAPKTKKAAGAKRAAAPAKKPAKPVIKKVATLQDFILATLDSDKAIDIVSLPLKGKTTIADYMLIATGTSSRHVAGMAAKLRDKLSTERGIKARVEGLESGDWAIIDAGDVMVHLFREEVRDFYDLEKLWGADFSTVNYTRYQSV